MPDVLDLTGGRLRPVQPGDWRLDQELSRVPDVTRWTYYPADVSDQQARARVARNIQLRQDGRGGRFIIETGGQPVGTIGISLRVDGPYLYYALSPAARGRGLVTSAVTALTAWAFAEGERQVHALTMLGNTASERVLERAAFVQVGIEVQADGVSVTRWVTPRVTYGTVG